MPRFFVREDQIKDDVITIKGEDVHHISRVLRMARGDNIVICDMNLYEYDCVLDSFSDTITARVLAARKIYTEPPYRARLYQSLPKGDKLDGIIQKAVECGVYEITIFESERCVAHHKNGDAEKKNERRRRISLEAAKQSGRGIVPEVRTLRSFREMLAEASLYPTVLFCYEGSGTTPLRSILRSTDSCCGTPDCRDIAIIIGPEGGFSPTEVEMASDSGALITGLGKRVLRTETAAAFVLASLVYEYEL